MQKTLTSLIKARVPNANKESIEEIINIFEEKKFAKGHIFKHAGNRSSYLGFIIEGMASMQWVNNQKKHHIQIFTPNHLITDPISIREKIGSPLEIIIEQDAVIGICSVKEFNKLLSHSLTLNIFLRDYVIEKSLKLGERLTLFLSGDSHQRYKHLIKTHPELLTDFPLKTTASMLGVSPTQLSRLRKK